ncbi:MAG: hypothetical protein SF066_00510 [Thermoanaerobaculia bacterium]|nr:hypothetical protein [Thermoanaerobaculia bacterium]
MRRLLDYFRRPPDGRQLSLELAPAPGSAPPLAARLAPLFAGQLGRLVLTRNRSTLMSCRRNPDGRLTVRLHECFSGADDATLAAVAVLATTPAPTSSSSVAPTSSRGAWMARLKRG